jgi:tetratricopeptide (TPR) repeat protein
VIGTTISHFKILGKLGGGGMGVVYKAQDLKLDRFVALKFLPPDLTRDSESKQRFIHEAKAASALQHNNICTVHDIDETDDGQIFIVMDLYEGETLKKQIERGPLKIDEAIDIAIQIAQGLEEAHKHQIVHRDIKPANVLITASGVVKIVDFGLAKLAGQSRVTRTGSTIGTAAYMSPEQAQGLDVDHRTDIWSLGVVLFEMLTGKLPFRGEHEAALMYSITNQEPVPPTSVRGDIPEDLEKIILRLLQKDPRNRYQSAADLRDDLQRFLGEPPTPRPLRMLRAVFRQRFSVPLTAALTVVTVAAILFAMGVLQRWVGHATMPDKLHIAVLPFTNIGGDSSNAVFSSGLFEIITRKLAQLHRYRADMLVFSPAATRTIQNANDAYRNLGASIAVDCSVQWQPSQAQVTVSLEDARTSVVIDSRTIRSESVMRSRLENEVINAIADMIGIQLNSADLEGLAAGGTKDENANDLYVQARGELLDYLRLAKLNNAINLFQRAIGADPQCALAHAGLGEAYWRRYETTNDRQWVDSAITACQRAVNLNSDLVEVHLSLGMIYLGTGKDSTAILEFQGILSKDSLNVDVYRNLGDAYQHRGDTTRAEASFKKAISIQPNDWRSYHYLGRYYYFRSRSEETIAMWKQVTTLRPDYGGGYSNLGVVYFQLGRWGEAREQFEQAITKDTTNYPAYSNLGTLYFYDGMFELAANAYDRVLKLNASNHVAWNGLAASYRAMGSTKLAKEASAKAATLAENNIKVNPRDAITLATLAGYDADLGKKGAARSLLGQAILLAPNDPDVLGRAGMVYEQLGERKQALKWIQQALKRGYSTTNIDHGPEMKGLREDPAYQKLLKEIVDRK